MNKNRVIGLIVGAALIVAVILISLGFKAAPQAQGSSRSAAGMGDLRRFDAQPAVQKSSSAYVGMGDLARVDAQPAIQKSNSASVSVIEAQILEAQLLNLASASQLDSISAARVEENLRQANTQGGSSSSVRRGDLARVAAQPAIQRSSSASVSVIEAQILEAQLLSLASASQLDSISAARVEENMRQAKTQGSSRFYVGMGDLHRFDSSR
jgi:hypothetical protein